MFRRAVSNLLSNALRYTPEAGDISIRIASTAQATTLTVENTGINIDARIFLDCSTASTAPMLPVPIRTPMAPGLGLAITRAIAQAHGGRVTGGPASPWCFLIGAHSHQADKNLIGLSRFCRGALPTMNTSPQRPTKA
ncbi:MAG: sensor histidine kinase [Propionivibrio sp.]|nr:sensor histidine kinase [Propionivibrio sp.]